MNHIAEEFLMHYGVKQRSGRYPWGSGDDPYQHSGDFLSRVQELEKQGLSQTEIVKVMKLDSTTQLRVAKSIAKNERRALTIDRIKSLQKDGKNISEIAREMGKNESSIRGLLEKEAEANMNRAQATADILKKELSKKHMIDVGIGVERELGISETKLKEALFMLEAEGYKLYGIGVPQVTNPGKQTNVKLLCDPDITYHDAYQNIGNIESLRDYHSNDGGNTFTKLKYPASIGSDRVMIRYNEEGGLAKDGVIELRRGVDDLSLGKSHYAQVRILVDDTHYLKGMAMYSDDIPEGVDIVFNTNKTVGTTKMKVLKEIKDDPDNPFGALIKANGQSTYIDKKGKEQLGAINKLKEEGDWDTMAKNLSSQFLSKQPLQLIKKQLGLTYDDVEANYKEICELNNPTLKKKLLLDFADECDSATVHLKAAALPRQKTQVILPINDMKETEIYAPNYENGEVVSLVRFPHGGTFEIPQLVVNNKNTKAKAILGNVTDAVGINALVAERLSGADFDGDTVVVIPTNSKIRITATRPLKDLEGFDPKTQYSTDGKTGVKLMEKSQVQKQMGSVSNLITDMTLRGAPPEDLARAVKHSMVVIDAHKHKLDYKQSEKDQGIRELKQTYQKYIDLDGNAKVGGASTLLSRKKQDIGVPERQGSGIIDPETGKVKYKETGRTYIDAKGNTVPALTKVKLMTAIKDAHTISSGTPQENLYADFANKLKNTANTARKEYKNTPGVVYNSSAHTAYQKEVDSLLSKLNVAAKNAPRERRAQVIANANVKAKQQANPDMDKKELKKTSQIEINNARAAVGASGKDSRISIDDREWEAIQAGAISDTQLSKILKYTDQDAIKQRATPKTTTLLSAAKISKVKRMAAMGYTNAEIASAVGVSASSVSKYINE